MPYYRYQPLNDLGGYYCSIHHRAEHANRGTASVHKGCRRIHATEQANDNTAMILQAMCSRLVLTGS